MRPLTVVDGDCGKIGADSSIGGMAAHVPLWVEAAPQRPQVAPERVRREVAWHLDLPLLEAAPPQERVAQEEYHRLPVVCDSTGGMTSLELGRIGGVAHTGIPTNVPIPARPLSERLIGSFGDAAWGMSKLIISDPKRLEDPGIAGQAKAEMKQFNALSKSNGTVSGEFETGISVAEMFASFGAPHLGDSRHAIPNIRTPVFNPSNPMQLDWAFAFFSGGTLERIRGP